MSDNNCVFCGRDVTQRVVVYDPLYSVTVCGVCQPAARRLLLACLAHVNAEAEAAMLRTHVYEGAHHRAIEAELKRLAGPERTHYPIPIEEREKISRDRARLDYLEQACTVRDGDHTSGLIETMDGPAISWGTLAADRDLREAMDRRMEQA